MTMELRVYVDLVEAAPEPIGWVHQDCRGEVPNEDDGYELLVEHYPADDHEDEVHPAEGEACFVCGTTDAEVCARCGTDLEMNCLGTVQCPDCETCPGCYSG